MINYAMDYSRYKNVSISYAKLNKFVFIEVEDIIYKADHIADWFDDAEEYMSPRTILADDFIKRINKTNLWFGVWTRLRLEDETGFDFHKGLR